MTVPGRDWRYHRIFFFFFLRDRHLISLTKLSSRGRENTERIAGRNLYRPATREREKLSLDESPARSCERRKSMTRRVTSRSRSRDRIGMSMGQPRSRTHHSLLSHSFRLTIFRPPCFANLFAKLARSENVPFRQAAIWQVLRLSKVNEG